MKDKKMQEIIAQGAEAILIRKDKAMRKKYEQIKARAGGKRAIVAVSRKLILCIKRLLLDKRPYVYEPVI